MALVVNKFEKIVKKVVHQKLTVMTSYFFFQTIYFRLIYMTIMNPEPYFTQILITAV